MKQNLQKILKSALETLGISDSKVQIEFAENLDHGDFYTNCALIYSKEIKKKPIEIANALVEYINTNKPSFLSKIEVAGPGFINFFINKDEILNSLKHIGTAQVSPNPKQILVEHTDPNTFKPFHIGHLMANAIGESLSRLKASGGDEVIRICYPSDIGLHIGKAIWAISKSSEIPKDDAPIVEKTAFLGKMYAEGNRAYDTDNAAKAEIEKINKHIYEKSDQAAEAWYEKGKKWSMEHFELLFKKLGTSFDDYIYESEVSASGLALVKEHIGKIFEESEGAVIFAGEKYGLHTRVFINSQGLPTYETKELGLNTKKIEKYPKAEMSIIITANEQNEYFKVLIKVLTLISEEVGQKTKHIGHGMLRLSTGKMSSRTGHVITAEDFISDIRKVVLEKMSGRMSQEEQEKSSEKIAIGAIKYSILRQAIGSDIIFDRERALSLEGDSGPYLQYGIVRAKAVMQKGVDEKIPKNMNVVPEQVGHLERLLFHFEDVVYRSRTEEAPQYLVNFLTEITAVFNSFYSQQTIVDKNDPLSTYYLSLVDQYVRTMEKGLDLLAIPIPEKM